MIRFLQILEAVLISCGLAVWLDAPWYGQVVMTLAALHLVRLGTAAEKFCTAYEAALKVGKEINKRATR